MQAGETSPGRSDYLAVSTADLQVILTSSQASPFLLLPDELILSVAKYLPIRTSLPGLDESRTTTDRSLESLAGVNRRMRRLALSVRWEVRALLPLRTLRRLDCADPASLRQNVTLHLYYDSTRQVMERLHRHGHLVQTLELRIERGKSLEHLGVLEQFLHLTTCLAVCERLRHLAVYVHLPHEEPSTLAAVLRNVAARVTPERDFLSHEDLWCRRDRAGPISRMLSAANSLGGLEVSLRLATMDSAGRRSTRIEMPLLPPLPNLSSLCVASARCIAPTTFGASTSLKSLCLERIDSGDLTHIAACVGPVLERLVFAELVEGTLCEHRPLSFPALRHLKVSDTLRREQSFRGEPILLTALFHPPTTPIRTLELVDLQEDVFTNLQRFVNSQPVKTIESIRIQEQAQLSVRDDFSWRRFGELQRSHERAQLCLLERCIAWGHSHNITIQADW